MISNIRLLLDKRFRLVHNMEQTPFSNGPDAKELLLLHTGYKLIKELKKGVNIYPSMLLGSHPSPDMGHLFSPVRGKVLEITPRFIRIEILASQEEDPVQEEFSQELIRSKFAASYDEAIEFMRDLGVNPRDIAMPCDTLIINGLNPEPGVTWAEPLLNIHSATALLGLELQIAFAKPKRIILAVHEDAQVENLPNTEVHYVEPVYPISLTPLIKKAVTGEESPKNTNVVSTHALWVLGRMLEQGKPVTETLVTLGTPTHSSNYIIPEGTRVIDLLNHANVALEGGDSVVLGGPLQGNSVSLPERGIPKHIHGVFVVPAGSVPELEGSSPCCNCGACDKVCPARLSPSTISRYAEFAHFDKCKENYAEYCMECGLCGYVCIMRRPVLQYIRLAKQKLALEELKPLTKDADATETISGKTESK